VVSESVVIDPLKTCARPHPVAVSLSPCDFYGERTHHNPTSMRVRDVNRGNRPGLALYQGAGLQPGRNNNR